jgi:fido (protein-threonine AMPylation protein)
MGLRWIHPFVNGNGRHARLMADLLLTSLGLLRFSWGSEDLSQTTGKRARYIDPLRLADRGDFSQIISFARST